MKKSVFLGLCLIDHFKKSLVNIGSLNKSNTYIAKTVTLSKNTNTVIKKGNDLFINASEVVLYPGFSVESGGQLIVLTNNSN